MCQQAAQKTATEQLIGYLMEAINSKQHPSEQVVIYLDGLHPTDDDLTLEDLIREAHREKVVRLFPRMVAILKSLNEYEDDRPAPGTRGHEIYHDAVEVLAEVNDLKEA